MFVNTCVLCWSSGIVHENPQIGSDGESEGQSATSDEKDDTISPVKLRVRPRRFSEVSNFWRDKECQERWQLNFQALGMSYKYHFFFNTIMVYKEDSLFTLCIYVIRLKKNGVLLYLNWMVMLRCHENLFISFMFFLFWKIPCL